MVIMMKNLCMLLFVVDDHEDLDSEEYSKNAKCPTRTPFETQTQQWGIVQKTHSDQAGTNCENAHEDFGSLTGIDGRHFEFELTFGFWFGRVGNGRRHLCRHPIRSTLRLAFLFLFSEECVEEDEHLMFRFLESFSLLGIPPESVGVFHHRDKASCR